jgi:hypothetical protein
MLIIVNQFIDYDQGSPRECRGGVAPPGKIFRKKSQRGDQGKIYPPSLDFLRNLRENLKGGTKGYFLD